MQSLAAVLLLQLQYACLLSLSSQQKIVKRVETMIISGYKSFLYAHFLIPMCRQALQIFSDLGNEIFRFDVSDNLFKTVLQIPSPFVANFSGS